MYIYAVFTGRQPCFLRALLYRAAEKKKVFEASKQQSLSQMKVGYQEGKMILIISTCVQFNEFFHIDLKCRKKEICAASQMKFHYVYI